MTRVRQQRMTVRQISSGVTTVTNLVTNPSAETSLTGWTARLGYVSRFTGSPAVGSYYVNLINAGGGDADITLATLVDETTYTLSYYAKMSSGASAQIVAIHDTVTVHNNTSLTTGWARYTQTFTATASSIITLSMNVSGSDKSIDIDGIMLTEGSTLYEYFDGDSDGGSWLGTAHASKSTKNFYEYFSGDGWHEVGGSGEPAFQNSWVNYGSGWTNCEFFKDEMGIVRIKGLVKNGTANTVVFTLPVGYRPLKIIHFTALGAQTTPMVTGNVLPNGEVKQRTGTNGYFSLDRLAFRAEQ